MISFLIPQPFRSQLIEAGEQKNRAEVDRITKEIRKAFPAGFHEEKPMGNGQ